MEACPCCGYRTLPFRGDYELCPVCWWEDEPVEPWEYSGANGQVLAHAQRDFLARRRPSWARWGKGRAPRPVEARAPGWRPYELSDEQEARVRRDADKRRIAGREEALRVADAVAADPEGPFAEYNAAVRSLRAVAPGLSYGELERRLRQLDESHGLQYAAAHVELRARLLADEHYYRRHRLRAAWWVLRHARPGTLRRRLEEVRSGVIRGAG